MLPFLLSLQRAQTTESPEKNVDSIASLDTIVVDLGEEPTLPATAEVTFDDGSVEDLAINWSITYDEDVAGFYVVEGDPVLSGGTNLGNVKAVVGVNVLNVSHLVVTDTNEYVVGLPQNNGAFFDGTYYWIFRAGGGTLRCRYGTDLSSLAISATGITTVGNSGRAYGVVFGRISTTWYAWVHWEDSAAGNVMKVTRFELTSGGLANASTVNSSTLGGGQIAEITKDYGGEIVSELYYTSGENNHGVGLNAAARHRRINADMTGDTAGFRATTSYNGLGEHSPQFKLSDGFVALSLQDGENADDDATDSGKMREFTKTTYTNAWDAEVTVEGDVTGATAGDGDFTDQNHADNTSHTGQQDIVQTDDGKIYVLYINNDDTSGADFGKMILNVRGSAIADGWSNISKDVAGEQAWHVSLATDGTNLWVIYCPNNGGVRSNTIKYRKYTVSGATWGPLTSLVLVQASHTFVRMFSQLRAKEKIVLSWSELEGTDYDQMATEIII